MDICNMRSTVLCDRTQALLEDLIALMYEYDQRLNAGHDDAPVNEVFLRVSEWWNLPHHPDAFDHDTSYCEGLPF